VSESKSRSQKQNRDRVSAVRGGTSRPECLTPSVPVLRVSLPAREFAVGTREYIRNSGDSEGACCLSSGPMLVSQLVWQ
jgi:hypothetical protein